MKLILITIALLGAFCSAYGQKGNWDITTRSNRVLSRVLLERLSGDTLYVYRDGMGEGIPIGRIAEMKRRNSTYAWIGGITGVAAGGYLGAQAGQGVADIFTGAVAIPVLSATLGGFLGAAAGGALSPDDLYDLRGMTHEQQRASVEYLILHD